MQTVKSSEAGIMWSLS